MARPTANNRTGFNIFDYHIYAICGRWLPHGGDFVRSGFRWAGHLGPSTNLCWIFDNNHITIEGDTSIAFYGRMWPLDLWRMDGTYCAWGDANDTNRIEYGPSGSFSARKGRPTFIVLDSHVGYGSPNRQGSAAAHGEPLGDEQVRPHETLLLLARRTRKFLVPEGVYEHFAEGVGRARSESKTRMDPSFLRLLWPISGARQRDRSA